jgi:hypothetical protein
MKNPEVGRHFCTLLIIFRRAVINTMEMQLLGDLEAKGNLDLVT